VVALGAAALAMAGCGGGGAETLTYSRGASAPAAVFQDWSRYMRRGNVRTACRLMTANGRRSLAAVDGQSCDSTEGLSGPAPKPGPAGVAKDLALLVVKYPNESFIAVLRREGGRWLVDLPQPAPIPRSLASPGTPRFLVERLPLAGPTSPAFGAAARYVDRGVTSGRLDREHVGTVAVVGHVALAYLVAGSDAGGTATSPVPAGTPTRIVVLAKGGGRWRITPVSIGSA
jgi:hypothetical protein